VVVTRKWLLVVGGVLVTVAVGWWVLQVALLDSPDRGNAATYGQFVLAAVGLLISLAALWKTLAPSRTEPGLDELTDRLALAMRNQWTNAANERRLLQPAPLPIRWHRSGDPVVGPVAAAARADHGFDPLPGLDRVTSSRLRRGTRRDLHRIYGGLASGRLMIVGGPGTGKSSAAVLLLLDALRYRDQATPDDRSRIPVPVLFTLQNWNPETTSVEAWLHTKLAEIPVFNGRPRDAVNLLRAGRIAVFLDGLDEIPAPVRPLALQALSEQATFRLVLLTRTKELAKAAERHGLIGAVALQLENLRPADVADYLLRPLVEPVPPAWQKLTATLTDNPDGALAQALTIPLGVSLLRDIYTPGEPVDELCETERFSDPEDIINHLLDQAIEVAYAPRPGQRLPRYTAETANRALSFIARHLDGKRTHDLAWWAIPTWLNRKTRLAVNTIFEAGLTALGAGIIFGVLGGPGVWMHSGLLGVIVGLLFGLYIGLMRPKTAMRTGSVQWRRVLAINGLLPALVIGSFVGLLIGLALGVLGGLVATTAFILGGTFSVNVNTPVNNTDSASPVKAWRGDVASGLGYGLIVGPAFGFAFSLAGEPLLGLVWGLAGGLALGSLPTQASVVAAIQIYLAVRHRMPLRLIRFLEDARSRHLLRTVGPVYQFRHATLQDRLAAQ
jgi:hypothetical protein